MVEGNVGLNNYIARELSPHSMETVSFIAIENIESRLLIYLTECSRNTSRNSNGREREVRLEDASAS